MAGNDDDGDKVNAESKAKMKGALAGEEVKSKKKKKAKKGMLSFDQAEGED